MLLRLSLSLELLGTPSTDEGSNRTDIRGRGDRNGKGGLIPDGPCLFSGIFWGHCVAAFSSFQPREDLPWLPCHPVPILCIDLECVQGRKINLLRLRPN